MDIYSIKEHISKMHREVAKNKYLKQILDGLGKVEFALEYHKGTRKEKKVIDLIEELKNTHPDENDHIIEELKKLTPKPHVKKIILAEYLSQKADEIGVNLAIDNTYFYYYNGEFWEVLDMNIGMAFFSEVFMRAGYNRFDSLSVHNLESFFKQLAFSCQIPKQTMAINTMKINLKNGTFTFDELKQEKVDFQSSDFLKYQLPFDYNKEAIAPKFFFFLDEVLPKKSDQMILAEYIGYVFTKGLKLEKALILMGLGANGKSVIFDIINALLGETNISSYTLSDLCNENRYYTAQLGNKLLNYSSELGGRGSNPDMVKKLISGEAVTARPPYGKPFEIKDYCKFMFNTNLFPKDIEQSQAYYRRFIYLVFDKTIPEGQRNPDLAKEIISTELSGIFNWVLEGLQRILKNREFTHSDSAVKALNDIKLDSDSVALFMDEQGYVKDNNEYEISKTLFSDYKDFCKEDNYRAVSNREFLRRLESVLVFRVDRNKTNRQTWIYCKKEDVNKESNKEHLSVVEKFVKKSLKK